MSRANAHAVRSLVVARLRELAAEPSVAVIAGLSVAVASLMRLAMTVEFVARALASSPATRAMFALIVAFAGVAVGRAASARLPFSWFDPRRVHSTLSAAESMPALPVTGLERLAATSLIACLLGAPFVAAVVLSWTWSPTLWQWGVLELTCFVALASANVAWHRVGGVRLRAAVRMPRALVVPARWRRGPVSATWWVLMPSTMLIAGAGIAWLMPFVVFMLHNFAGAVADPVIRLVMYPVASLPAAGMLTSGLYRVAAQLAALPVSRRSVALAELRLTLMLQGTLGLIPVVLAHVIVCDADFTTRIALLSVALGCAGALSRVIFVRLVNPSDHVGLVAILGSCTAFAALVVMVCSSYAPALVVGGFALLALACAAALAHTAPERPLSL